MNLKGNIFCILLMSGAVVVTPVRGPDVSLQITNGPMLGRPGSESMAVWARTSRPGAFSVAYGTTPGAPDLRSAAVSTKAEQDCTGSVHLTGLRPRTKYFYKVIAAGQSDGPGGSFRTLPDSKSFVHPTYNPKGLFNLKFEFGSCNNQAVNGPALPTYATMLRELKDKIDFAILNGDWVYEEDRDYSPDSWLKQVGIEASQKPRIVQLVPTLAGVWENYKTYLNRAPNLVAWHAQVPSFFVFDDHELLSDISATGTAGSRQRNSVFRDIGTRGWYNYLGWSNPVSFAQDIHFGQAQFEKDSEILLDTEADFTSINWKETSNLTVHWGTPTAGVNDPKLNSQPGDPNAGVYEIREVLDKHRLRIGPAARSTGRQSYSIGRHSFFKFSVGNCEFFVLDTRSQRDMHDIRQPDKPGISMLGRAQREWLIDGMKNSSADFLFVVSTVTFMIPHLGTGDSRQETNKDDAWTAFLEERERLVGFWDSLDKPVLILTGDLHNSFAIKITDRIWEFASGPHNSSNHRSTDEGGRPASGSFQHGPRACDIRWSSYALPDIPREHRTFFHYCVVQVNNVFNNPAKPGEERWVAFPRPQVIFQFYDGHTGELAYAEAIAGTKGR